MRATTAVRVVTDDAYEILTRRARRGAQMMVDKFGPTWVDKIDTEVLDLRSWDYCIVGQSFQGHFGDLGKLGKDVGTDPVYFGFDIYDTTTTSCEESSNTEGLEVTPGDTQLCYDALGEIWKKLIQNQRRQNRRKKVGKA